MVCLLLELQLDLNGSIICEFLGVKIENCKIIVHWLDTMQGISFHSLTTSSLWGVAHKAGKISRSVAVEAMIGSCMIRDLKFSNFELVVSWLRKLSLD